ncbi:hypothetical protein X777_17023, partial [Ooceraea biroi]
QPVVILEDLTTLGYRKFYNNLDEAKLKECMKLLAQFHAKTFNLKKENDRTFIVLLGNLERTKQKIIKERKEKVRYNYLCPQQTQNITIIYLRSNT